MDSKIIIGILASVLIGLMSWNLKTDVDADNDNKNKTQEKKSITQTWKWGKENCK